MRWNLAGDYTVDIPVVATNGTLQQYGKGKLTLSEVDLSDVLIQTEKDSGGMEILSGKGNDITIKNNSTNAPFLVQGCNFDGVNIYSDTKETDSVVLKDNEMKNMNLAFSYAPDTLDS